MLGHPTYLTSSKVENDNVLVDEERNGNTVFCTVRYKLEIILNYLIQRNYLDVVKKEQKLCVTFDD